MQQLRLKKGREITIQRKHPWIFSGGLQSGYKKINEGSIVRILDYQDNFAAIGHLHHSSIAVRILSFCDEMIDVSFYEKTLLSAWEKRETMQLPSELNNGFRLIAGEGDNLPGLIIDYYNKNLVVQCHTLGMQMDIEKIKTALLNLFSDWIETIYLKEIHIRNNHYQSRFLHGCSESTIITENNNQFEVNWVEGQKTGFFLDQRINRKLVGDYSKGKKILNTFCYTGGFSVYALKGGAKSVTSVDISKTAIEQTNKNVSINGSIDQSRHHAMVADVMKYLQNIDRDEYDIIILDPPAFAKSQKKAHNAIQAYKRINALALQKIKSGGLLFSFSCSQVINLTTFEHTLRAAAIETRRDIRVIHFMHQSPDHMVNIYHTEGHYLKGMVLLVQ